MLRIALLGCGRIGVMHAANIASHKRHGLARTALRSVGDGRSIRVSEIA
jgi:predicted dehydrogenase